jgi:hypothetical protein
MKGSGLTLTYNPAPGGLKVNDVYGTSAPSVSAHNTSAHKASAHKVSAMDLKLSSPRHHTRPFLFQLCLPRSVLISQARIDLDGG